MFIFFWKICIICMQSYSITKTPCTERPRGYVNFSSAFSLMQNYPANVFILFEFEKNINKILLNKLDQLWSWNFFPKTSKATAKLAFFIFAHYNTLQWYFKRCFVAWLKYNSFASRNNHLHNMKWSFCQVQGDRAVALMLKDLYF